ncbi:AI-2E family transporter [Janibacter cremeus]|uniref:Putative PurR-regulated permease PerM n=1 Tax=Janibacter cremeus TaxID=1285192 RepID=A0A852VNU7_9MICO|nr:AI-2E family transporter [Janibacter cremeus]NYF97806.1 putative PurR-regulated permease PerM [Janibacter cremeus]
MSVKRRRGGRRLPRPSRWLPSLPAPREEAPIVIRTAPESSDGVTALPPTVRALSEWAWRSLVIAVALVALLKLATILAQVVIPVVVALLLAALLEPLFRRLRVVMPKGVAALITVIGTLAAIVALFSYVGNQFATQLGDIVDQVTKGLAQSRHWVESTLGLSEAQLTGWFADQWATISRGDRLSDMATQAGSALGQGLTGFLLAMFTLFFFLYDGPGIWVWVVRLFPRGARAKVLSSGAIAWRQLQAFTRATVLVAGVDAIGIGLGALALGVPFASGIALLVFIGSFVPIVGALVSGFIAVLLAFVAKGPITAVLMLGVVIAVQQIEQQLLQPLLLGRAVRVHPLAVILGITTGIILGGVIGALIAVPTVAVLNAVGHNLLDPTPEDVDGPEELTTDEEQKEIHEDVARAQERSDLDPGDPIYPT